MIQIMVVAWGFGRVLSGNKEGAKMLFRAVLLMAGAGAALTALTALTGCMETTSTPQAGRQIRGQADFEGYCVSCHGSKGRGDGVLAAQLPILPADIALLSDRNGGAFPMIDVMAKIYGYADAGHGLGISAVMPEFGSFLHGPTMMWNDGQGNEIETPKALVDLATYLETLQL